MMTFATIAAAFGVITLAAAEIDGFGAEALTSTTPVPTKIRATVVTEVTPTIHGPEKMVIVKPVNSDSSDSVAKAVAEIPLIAVVAAKEGVSENLTPTARIVMKHGTEEKNLVDWMDPDPTKRFDMKFGTDDENSTDWMK